MKIRNIGSSRTQVEKDDGTRILVSYSTPVAAYIVGRGYVRTSFQHSKTTNSHIKQWLDGAECETVAQAELDALVQEMP